MPPEVGPRYSARDMSETLDNPSTLSGVFCVGGWAGYSTRGLEKFKAKDGWSDFAALDMVTTMTWNDACNNDSQRTVFSGVRIVATQFPAWPAATIGCLRHDKFSKAHFVVLDQANNISVKIELDKKDNSWVRLAYTNLTATRGGQTGIEMVFVGPYIKCTYGGAPDDYNFVGTTAPKEDPKFGPERNKS